MDEKLVQRAFVHGLRWDFRRGARSQAAQGQMLRQFVDGPLTGGIKIERRFHQRRPFFIQFYRSVFASELIEFANIHVSERRATDCAATFAAFKFC